MTQPKSKFIVTKDVHISGTTYYTLNLKSGKVIDVKVVDSNRTMPDGTIMYLPIITIEQKINNMMSIIYRIPYLAGTLVPIKPGTVSKTRKYIINNDITLIGVASGVYPIPVIDLKRGDVIEGRARNLMGGSINGGTSVQIERDVTPASKTVYEIMNATVPYNRRNISAVSNNQSFSNNQSSSYLGESIIAKKSQQTKNILVIIAMLAILIVAYLAVTGKLFKSLELN